MAHDQYAVLLTLLDRLKQATIHYDLTAVRDAVMVQVAVPGQHWEIEFMPDGTVEIEKFTSDGTIYGSTELDVLFQEFAD
jgi:hypothetical protein